MSVFIYISFKEVSYWHAFLSIAFICKHQILNKTSSHVGIYSFLFLSSTRSQTPGESLEAFFLFLYFFSTDVPILQIFIWKFSILKQHESSSLIPTNSTFLKAVKVLYIPFQIT